MRPRLCLRLLLCLLGVVALCGAIAPSALAIDKNAILGQWYTAEKEALVAIYPCEGRYCGRIVWLKEPKNPDGTEKIDTHNPDQSRRHDPIIGLQLVSDFTFDGDGAWKGGRIYDPENGKTYSCKMVLSEDQRLKVRGYIGISLLGRTEVWTRASIE